MNDALRSLIALSKSEPMPDEERQAQRRSFVYGNTHFENSLITRKMVEEAVVRVDRAARKTDDNK